ncbi:MAG: methionyl-tRNA formyltransferase, partial [Bacteroidales bacterium]|nr:methionyl-tRNA formyltransferase [Bacteroidales bacterium]
MTNSDIRIVFMGTPEFAVAPLKAIRSAGMNIAGVVTAPDKPAGRGKKITQTAVKVYAEKALDCPVLQPEKLKDTAFIGELAGLKAHLFIVVAFRMLPEAVWTLPEHGTINLHASLLPHYRGAAPINWCIINGEESTGLTTFLIDREIDTGKILLQEEMTIGPDQDAGELHDRMMETGAALLVRTIEQVMQGTVAPVPQEAFNIPADQLKKAPKIFKPDCRIDWSRGSATVHNLIRGLSPFPGAFTYLVEPGGEQSMLKVFATKKTGELNQSPTARQNEERTAGQGKERAPGQG